jgi:hypothetical protein
MSYHRNLHESAFFTIMSVLVCLAVIAVFSLLCGVYGAYL